VTSCCIDSWVRVRVRENVSQSSIETKNAARKIVVIIVMIVFFIIGVYAVL